MHATIIKMHNHCNLHVTSIVGKPNVTGNENLVAIVGAGDVTE